MQWLSDASPYEMIELLAKDDVQGPRLWVLLTERVATRGSKRQVHLVNRPDLARSLEMGSGDREVHVVELGYERHEDASGATLHVWGATPLGMLDWSFTSQGLPTAEHGHRLVDATEAAHDLKGGLLVFYLEKSALSGEGTRLRLGDALEPVPQWSELSRPPHFNAYRGVYSRPAHVGYFPSLAPTTVELKQRTESADGQPHWSYTWQTKGQPATEALEITGTRRGTGWTFASEHFVHDTRVIQGEFLTERLTATDGAHTMTLSFNPPVADLSHLHDWRSQFTWELAIDGGERLLFGDLLVKKIADSIGVRLQPRSPAWARQLPLAATISLTERGYIYASHTEPPAP